MAHPNFLPHHLPLFVMGREGGRGEGEGRGERGGGRGKWEVRDKEAER